VVARSLRLRGAGRARPHRRPSGRTIPHLDTPIRPQNAWFEQITITDPAHPLYGRTFPLVSVSGSQHGTGYAYVDDHSRAVLRIPIKVTSLRPAVLDLPTSKLSLEAIRELVRLASHEEGIGRLIPPDAASPGPQAGPEPSPTIAPPSARG
jgi:hypothetical protein